MARLILRAALLTLFLSALLAPPVNSYGPDDTVAGGIGAGWIMPEAMPVLSAEKEA